ncbi:uncharacterized protein LOC141857626 [Brevipalpus obovatus]|uniref:uncharacterized protein LOC141857626 n=1 Tax=Brevipalpus obovatus TaxID=246614 RepID=UPI003D9FA6E4
MPRKYSSKKTERTLQPSVDGFTIDFLREASKDGKKNIFVSPIGIIVLYTILLEGARRKTAEQLMQVFHLKPQFKNVEEVRVEMEKLIRRLNQKDQDITVKMANKVVIDVGITLKASFQKIIQKNYSASIDREDFGDGTVLQEKLNKWVSQETNNLIRQLFDDPPQPSTVLILINVLYFKGSWVNCFEPCNERDDFYNFDGTKSSVKMMFLEQQKCFYSHLKEEGLKIVRLPYRKGFNMYIFMPSKMNGIQALIANLEPVKLREYIRSLENVDLFPLRMPLFRLEDSHKLHEVLPAMGLDLPFSGSADLTGMTNGGASVSKSIQKAVIIVDEKGTEASAATYSSIDLCMPDELPEFTLNRPFIFFIQDEETSVNLFAERASKQTEIGLQTSIDGFTVDFLRKVSVENDDENILVSPIGITILYTILLEGARGSTTDEIMHVFHMKPQFKNVGKIRIELKKLMKRFDHRDEDLTIMMANKVLINREYPLKPSFQQVVTDHYSASIDETDFRKGDAVIKKLNTWVARETDNVIHKLFDDPLDKNDILVLINVLYFKGLWLETFKPLTKKQYFNNIDETKSTVKMMRPNDQKFAFSHLVEENLKIIQLPYREQVSMYIFMPLKINGIQGFISHLKAKKIMEYIKSLEEIELLSVKIPKFSVEDYHDLVDILPRMGLKLPFHDFAEFSKISDTPVEVSESIQKVTVVVDEKGTVATAVTSVFVGGSSDISKETFILDRPFMFLIRDEETSVNLFAGIIKKLPNAPTTKATRLTRNR